MSDAERLLSNFVFSGGETTRHAWEEFVAERDRLRRELAEAVLALYPAEERDRVAELLAENARLRDERDELQAVVGHAASVITSFEEVKAENARLRDAVQTALGLALTHLSVCTVTECEQCVAFGQVYIHLGPGLDVSGNMGGNAGPTVVGGDGTSAHTQQSFCPACNAELIVWAWRDEMGTAVEPVERPGLMLVRDPAPEELGTGVDEEFVEAGGWLVRVEGSEDVGPDHGLVVEDPDVGVHHGRIDSSGRRLPGDRRDDREADVSERRGDGDRDHRDVDRVVRPDGDDLPEASGAVAPAPPVAEEVVDRALRRLREMNEFAAPDDSAVEAAFRQVVDAVGIEALRRYLLAVQRQCPDCGMRHDRAEHRRLEEQGAFDVPALRQACPCCDGDGCEACGDRGWVIDPTLAGDDPLTEGAGDE